MNESDIHARARNTDPGTSHAAAADMNKSGRALRHAEIVVTMVEAHPGCTSAELAQRDQRLSHYQINRRLRELVAAGLVVEGEARQCKVLGRKCLTWNPVP